MYTSIFVLSFYVVFVAKPEGTVLFFVTVKITVIVFKFCTLFICCCRLRGPTLEIGRMSQTFMSSLASSADLPPKTHDFLRTALITLFLVTVIFVMFLCVLLTAYIVISFT